MTRPIWVRDPCRSRRKVTNRSFRRNVYSRRLS